MRKFAKLLFGSLVALCHSKHLESMHKFFNKIKGNTSLDTCSYLEQEIQAFSIIYLLYNLFDSIPPAAEILKKMLQCLPGQPAPSTGARGYKMRHDIV